MALASHLDRQTLLKNPTRASVVRLLGECPGLPLTEILDRLRGTPGLETASQSRVAWHLRVLEKFGVVTSRRAGWWRRYYLAEGPGRGQFSALAVLQAPISTVLATFVAEEPGVGADALYARFQETFPRTRQAMDHHLRNLERAGLLVALRSGQPRAFAPTPRLGWLLDALGAPTPPAPPIQPLPPSFTLTSPGATTPPGSSPSTPQPRPAPHSRPVHPWLRPSLMVLRSEATTDVET